MAGALRHTACRAENSRDQRAPPRARPAHRSAPPPPRPAPPPRSPRRRFRSSPSWKKPGQRAEFFPIEGSGEELAFLERDARGQDRGVERTGGGRSHPGASDEREREQLENHRQVVGVTNETIKTAHDHKTTTKKT